MEQETKEECYAFDHTRYMYYSLPLRAFPIVHAKRIYRAQLESPYITRSCISFLTIYQMPTLQIVRRCKDMRRRKGIQIRDAKKIIMAFLIIAS
eukprot:jgi/Psemu1/311137/fgenesh1_kg.727_\